MTVYVDNEKILWRGKLWCHLVADTLMELHAFAAHLGLEREWFQDNGYYPHYDITIGMRYKALALGAIAGDRETIINCARKLRFEAYAPIGYQRRLI